MDAFRRYWAACAAGSTGAAVSAVALPVLVVSVLHASPVETGLVSAAQVIPYALLGIPVGVLVDRVRRHPLLVGATAARALLLASIPLQWCAGALSIGVLASVLFALGAASVLGVAATQSLLPALVPRDELVRANARLDQTDAVAQTAGPALGGALVAVLGAPGAFGACAAALVGETALLLRLRGAEPPRAGDREPVLRAALAGLRWTYRHPTLGPLALSTHLWFVANAAGGTLLALLALRTLGLGPLWFGVIGGVGGVGMLAGASLAPALGRARGVGRAIIAARAIYPLGWAVTAVVAATTPGRGVAIAALATAAALTGLAAGAENANEMGYWQSTTPDGLLGRTNATRRAGNRTCAAVGAALAGVAAAGFGLMPALLSVTALFVVAAAMLALSPLRRADA